jgi:flagellar biosynthesis GTPase FlhF
MNVTSPTPGKINSKFRPIKPLSSNGDTPSTKRHKKLNDETNVESTVEYPTEVGIPSKPTIKSLYENAIEDKDSYQSQLDDHGSGLLSLEEVLIPAVVMKEVEALKRVQAKAQRDAPQHVKALETCRCALYASAECAIGKAREARFERQKEQAERDAIREEERRQASEKRRIEKDAARQHRHEERAAARVVEKERRKREFKKKLPQNIELWREVAMLMTELTKLEKEERLWKETEENLKTQEGELSVREQEKQHVQEDEVDETDAQKKDALEIQVEHAVEDITLSSLRILQALRFVSDLVVQSNAAQKELYDKYTMDHQFHGYRGVKNPKALIRALVTD